MDNVVYIGFRGSQKALLSEAKVLGLTSQKLADVCGVSKQTFHRYASCERELPKDLFHKVQLHLEREKSVQEFAEELERQDNLSSRRPYEWLARWCEMIPAIAHLAPSLMEAKDALPLYHFARGPHSSGEKTLAHFLWSLYCRQGLPHDLDDDQSQHDVLRLHDLMGLDRKNFEACMKVYREWWEHTP